MATVAEQLRRAREEQKLDIYQVAEITKIKSDHIRALEAGDYQSFSAPVYIRGFVRSYARVLKLNVSDVGAALDAELNEDVRFREPPPLTNEPRNFSDFLIRQLARLKWRVAFAGLAVILVIILIITGIRRATREPEVTTLKRLGPGLYQPRQPSRDVLPLPTNRPPSNSAPR